jgi:hypothetical protein
MVPTPTSDADFADRTASVIRDLSVPSRALLVAFGGIAGQMEMPPFEFFRHTGSLEVKRVFVRDLDQCWYQTGIRGLGDGVEATAEALISEAERAAVDRVVYTGNSAGGFAAILFGVLSGADAVVAFSPQTTLTSPRHVRSRDRFEVMNRAIADRRFLDLRELIGAAPSVRIHVHYAKWNRLDRFHARRTRHLPSVTLHPHSHVRHSLVRSLRDSGELRSIFREALALLPG